MVPARGVRVDGFRVRLCGGGEWRSHGGCARRSEMCVERECEICWVLANTLVGGGEVAGSSCYLELWRSKPSERTSGVREIKIKEGGKKRTEGERVHVKAKAKADEEV